MENITDIKIDNDKVSFIFKGSCQEAAKLRKKIMNDIKCKSIDEVKFCKNTSVLNNETIAQRLGLLVVVKGNEGIINIKGPKMVKAKHVQNLTLLYPETPIVYLDKDEELKCSLVIKEGTGKKHAKWNPVYSINFDKCNGYYKFNMGLVGTLTFDEILKQL